jgi:hypothetical protein
MKPETEERIIQQQATITEGFQHLATKEELGRVRTEVSKANSRTLIILMGWILALQLPTWIALGQLLSAIVNLASKLPPSPHS